MTRTREMALFVRRMCRALGARVPAHWTDEQVLAFMETLITEKTNDHPITLH